MSSAFYAYGLSCGPTLNLLHQGGSNEEAQINSIPYLFGYKMEGSPSLE